MGGMSDLSSSSTLAEVQAAYDDNASYEEDSSIAKARAFVTACRLLLRRVPSLMRDGEKHEIQVDLKNIQAEMQRAQRWIAGAAGVGSGGAGFVQSSFENFRD